MRGGRRVLAVLAAAFAVVVLFAPPAGAEVDGPCTGQLDGQDVAPLDSGDPNDAIDVDANDTITAGATSANTINSYEVSLEFAGFSWVVASDDSVNDTQWSDTVDVSDYANFGVGLYKVSANSDAGASCTGAVLVNVTGKFPLTTVGGIVGLVLAGLGTLGVLNSIRKARTP